MRSECALKKAEDSLVLVYEFCNASIIQPAQYFHVLKLYKFTQVNQLNPTSLLFHDVHEELVPQLPRIEPSAQSFYKLVHATYVPKTFQKWTVHIHCKKI